MTEILIGALKNVQTSVEGRSSIARVEHTDRDVVRVCDAGCHHHRERDDPAPSSLCPGYRLPPAEASLHWANTLAAPVSTVAALTIEPVGYADRGRFTM